jgi:hypothetical protein
LFTRDFVGKTVKGLLAEHRDLFLIVIGLCCFVFRVFEPVLPSEQVLLVIQPDSFYIPNANAYLQKGWAHFSLSYSMVSFVLRVAEDPSRSIADSCESTGFTVMGASRLKRLPGATLFSAIHKLCRSIAWSQASPQVPRFDPLRRSGEGAGVSWTEVRTPEASSRGGIGPPLGRVEESAPDAEEEDFDPGSIIRSLVDVLVEDGKLVGRKLWVALSALRNAKSSRNAALVTRMSSMPWRTWGLLGRGLLSRRGYEWVPGVLHRVLALSGISDERGVELLQQVL